MPNRDKVVPGLTLDGSETARVIETARHERIFAIAIDRIGIPKLVAVIWESKIAEWAYCALRDIPDLAEGQRTTLCDVIVESRDRTLAQLAINNIRYLTYAQHSALLRVAQAA